VSAVTGWLRAWGPRLIAGAALATVATVAGMVSYTHIDALTLTLHGSAMSGHLMPLGIDGLIVVGSIVLLTVQGGQARWGWLCIAPGVAASLFANWESGIAHGYLAAGWATMPALSFAVATFVAERWAKAQVAGVASAAAANTGASDGGDDGEKANPCPHSLAMTAEEGLVQAFLHIRDCLWQEPSQRRLSAAFGISRPRVAELVAPYLPEGAPEVPEPSLNGGTPGA